MEFLLNPDRERMNLTLVMALLVNGRTVLEDFSWPSGAERFANALKEFGLEFATQGHQLVLTGKGFQYSLPSVLPYDFGELENVLLWTLASKDSEQLYTFIGDDLESAKQLLQKYFKIKPQTDEPGKFVFSFEPAEPSIRKDTSGSIPYIMRNRLLIRALVRSEYLTFEEKSPVRDQLTRMFQFFGVALKYEGRGMEQLSEFERRLMMAQGKKIERTQTTELSETRVLTAHDYFVPGDTSEAVAIAVLTAVGNVPKENAVKILNVDLNTSRSGAISCLKRMGVNVDNATRREKFGDVFGDLDVFPMAAGKRLQGRRFGEDAVASSLSEYALLAVAACFAEGETILRLPKENRAAMRPMNEFLAENLRKTGVEVGVYEDGMVIRGMETILKGSDFSAGEWPEVGLALTVLSLALQNDEPIEGADLVEATYPGILAKLEQVLVSEKTEEVES
ncbi:MAG: 3-phosphoshikimate 1-carboxyvinyltransferase [Fibrobacter sp.]|nr:3-phosphoshikimate 1-carboxyvinyltransferase [Fibrobacter sp.]